MNDEESLQPNNISAEPSSNAPQSSTKSSPYEMLLRQSRKMGGLATRTYDVTREFLKKDVTVLNPTNPDRILFGKRLKTDKDKADFRSVVRRSHEVLASARTVILPINLFPDTVTVDRTKITIHKRTFFWSSQVISIRIEDILNVACSVGPLFGSLTVSSRVMNSTDHFEINYFWRKDALYMKQLIQGYFIAQHNQIETQPLSRKELIETLLELGSDSLS